MLCLFARLLDRLFVYLPIRWFACLLACVLACLRCSFASSFVLCCLLLWSCVCLFLYFLNKVAPKNVTLATLFIKVRRFLSKTNDFITSGALKCWNVCFSIFFAKVDGFCERLLLTKRFTGYTLSNWSALNLSKEETFFSFACKTAIF